MSLFIKKEKIVKALKNKVILMSAKTTDTIPGSSIIIDTDTSKNETQRMIIVSISDNDSDLKVNDVVFVAKKDLKPIRVDNTTALLYTDIESILAVLDGDMETLGDKE
jgi:co-chaperonin GroES (HSP10)